MVKTNSTKLQVFKARQRKGDVTRITELTGYSQPHVSNVLGRRRSNPFIVDAAYDISFRRKANSQLVNA